MVLSVFADDSSACSPDLVYALPPLCKAQCQTGLATGLILNLPQCQLPFPIGGHPQRLAPHVERLGLGYAN
eukprot:9488542-Pyramimonas_sp.AAC.1